MRAILTQLAVVTAILVAVALSLGWLSDRNEAQTYSLICVGFFAAVTGVSLYLVQRALGTGRPGAFVNAVMANFGIRLLSSAGLALVLLLAMDGDPVLVLVPLGSCYLIFTILEAFWLIRLNKQASKG
jgi:hypothetical protein